MTREGIDAPCGVDAAAIPAPLVAELRNAHTGNSTSSFGGSGCVGFDFGDDVARGFVTIDSVTQCTTENPTSAGYFAGIADSRNIYWGDVFHVDRARTLTRAENLVHVETSLDDPEVTDAGEYTFYMRHVTSDASDRREPLATRFGTRFFEGLTRLEVWRDIKVAAQPPVACGTNPSWFPLGQEEIVVFNEQEDVFGVSGAPFPLATNRVPSDALGIPFPTGWIYLNLNTTVAGQAGPTEDAAAAQAWVGVAHEESERFSAGVNAVPFDNATTVFHPLVCGGSCP